MRKSNIYRLIGLDLFPRPVQLGGSRWIAAEVEEFVLRCKDERDRQHSQNNFAPRPSILSAQAGALNGSTSENKDGTPASRTASTVRILSPELCAALRILKLDIPELYLDPEVWSVSLAIIKVELSPANTRSKHQKQVPTVRSTEQNP
jgi:hypothetical protein